MIYPGMPPAQIRLALQLCCLPVSADCRRMAYYDLYLLETLTRLKWLSLYRLNTISHNFRVGLSLLYSLSRLSQLRQLRLGSPDSRYWKQISTSAYGIVQSVREGRTS